MLFAMIGCHKISDTPRLVWRAFTGGLGGRSIFMAALVPSLCDFLSKTEFNVATAGCKVQRAERLPNMKICRADVNKHQHL